MSSRVGGAPARSRPPRPAPRPRLTVAPEVARRRLRARVLVWASGVVTVASLFMLVAFHVFAAQSAFTLDRLEKDRRNEQLRYERLREQVARLSSAGTVIAEARRLGMVEGENVVPLNVENAAPTTPNATPTAWSVDDYEQLKSALDQNP